VIQFFSQNGIVIRQVPEYLQSREEVVVLEVTVLQPNIFLHCLRIFGSKLPKCSRSQRRSQRAKQFPSVEVYEQESVVRPEATIKREISTRLDCRE
jgi:hypothetical protein